ncbi:MAG: ribonuclease P protein component [Thiohalomonadaceae bacterium]
MHGAYGFPRNRRLLRPQEFQRIFKGADWRIAGAAFTLLAAANTLGYPRLGVALAKRQVRHAVERNRIRRQLRESFRLHQHQLGGIDIVVLGRAGIDTLSSQELRAAIDRSWEALAKRCKES